MLALRLPRCFWVKSGKPDYAQGAVGPGLTPALFSSPSWWSMLPITCQYLYINLRDCTAAETRRGGRALSEKQVLRKARGGGAGMWEPRTWKEKCRWRNEEKEAGWRMLEKSGPERREHVSPINQSFSLMSKASSESAGSAVIIAVWMPRPHVRRIHHTSTQHKDKVYYNCDLEKGSIFLFPTHETHLNV